MSVVVVCTELRGARDVDRYNDVRHADGRLVSHLLRATRSFQHRSTVRCSGPVDVVGPSYATAAPRRKGHDVARARTVRRLRPIRRLLVSAARAHRRRPALPTTVQGRTDDRSVRSHRPDAVPRAPYGAALQRNAYTVNASTCGVALHDIAT